MDQSLPVSVDQQGATGCPWQTALLIIAVGFAVELGVYWSSALSAVELWSTSSAYNYGFLIAPISLYLIWTDWQFLRRMTPSRAWFGILLTVGFGALWLLAELMGVDEGRHFAFVGMLQGILLFALGWQVYRRMAFALLFLWLMVPTGEFLVEPLQYISRDGAIFLLNVTSIPFFVDDLIIEVPTGRFIVERGCSGLNLLLASLALSLLYGKMNYRRWTMRVLAVAVAVGLSVIANMIRVFLIVAITQWSDRRINIADDHVLYGWIFFGIIMLVVMWFGMRFADQAPASPSEPISTAVAAPSGSFAASFAGLGAVLATLTAFPMYAAATGQAPDQGILIVDLPPAVGEWRLEDSIPRNWRPGLSPNDGSIQGVYVRDGKRIDAAIGYCAAQGRRCESTAAENQPVEPDSALWNRAISGVHDVAISGRRVGVNGTELFGREGRLVLSWYESAGCLTARRLEAMLCAARQRLMGRNAPGAFVALSSETGEDRAAAAAALDSLAAQWPESAAFVRFLKQ